MTSSTTGSGTGTGVHAAGLPAPDGVADETLGWLVDELARDFPTTDAAVLAAAAGAALAEFTDARIRLYVHVLALRMARDLVRSETGALPDPRSSPPS